MLWQLKIVETGFRDLKTTIMKKLLVPTDFSTTAERAISFAIELAKQSGGEIFLLHVYDHIKEQFSSHKEIIKEYNTQQVQERSQQLRSAQETISKEGIPATTLLYSGEVSDTIIWAAKENGVDCIVMGTLGATGLKTAIFGTKTASVLSETSIPVITIPFNYTWKTPHKLLLAINDAEEDPKLFQPAFDLTDLFQAQVETLIFSEERAVAVDVMEHARVLSKVQQRLSQYYSKYPIETIHVTGKDFQQTVQEFIDMHQVDLLVMITHRRKLLQNLFKFSLTRQMAYHTTIPLLSLHSMRINYL